MSERPFPGFKFSNLTNYNGPVELGSDLWPFVGPATGTIVAGVKTFARTAPHNPSIQWTIMGKGEGCEGLKLQVTKPYAGVDSKGEPLERQTADIMMSAAIFELDTVKQHAAAGTEVQPENIIEWCVGRDVFFDISRYTDENGNQRSGADNFITRERYTEKMSTPGLGRKDPPAQAPARRAQGPAAPVGGVANIGGAPRPAVPVAGAFGAPAQGGFPGLAAVPAAGGIPAAPAALSPAAPPRVAGTPNGSPTLAVPTIPTVPTLPRS